MGLEKGFNADHMMIVRDQKDCGTIFKVATALFFLSNNYNGIWEFWRDINGILEWQVI